MVNKPLLMRMSFLAAGVVKQASGANNRIIDNYTFVFPSTSS